MFDAVHDRSSAASTSARLTAALLSYFALVIVVITVSPFDFAVPERFRLYFLVKTGDIVGNITMFLPLGFLLRSLGNGGRPRWQDVAAAGTFSTLVEIAQIFIRDRYVSPLDVATNSLGAYFGVVLRDRLDCWAHWHPRLVDRLGLHLPLVGLLYLLVPQFWLNSVGLVDDRRRVLTTLLLGCAGSLLLVSLYRFRWRRDVPLGSMGVPLLVLLWFTASTLPALSDSPRLLAGAALGIVALTAWLVRGDTTFDERRFERSTLRQFLPVFSAYLVMAALWPPFRGVVGWHGALGFSDRLNDAGVLELLLLLEQVGAFTLIGYAAAEWRGRRELSIAADLPRVACVAALLAAGLEVVQAHLEGPGASLLRGLVATSGALYGAAVYHLARAHVRALRGTASERPASQAAA
jgi:VanZ family protein